MKIILLSILTTITLTLNAQMDSTSYSVGLVIAKNLKSQGINDLDQASFMDAFNDVFQGKTPKLTLAEANNNFRKHIEKQQEEAGAENKVAGEAFLTENLKNPNIQSTPSGLQYEIVEAGDATGAKPSINDKVKVHYHGTLIDGTVFDSSVDRGEPISFQLGQVIKGWQEGLQLMTVGSKYRLYIPYDLAYGPRAAGAKIAAYSALIFDVTLLAIE